MKLVVGNQKNYLTKDKVDEFIKALGSIESDNVIICPSSIYVGDFKNMGVLLGGQNISCYDSGANTGEVSSEQLKSAGINFCIVGHSERRQNQHESIEETNIKIKKLLKEKVIPILCIGETKEEKDQGRALDILTKEIDGAFNDLLISSISKVIIAYEPIWSIGTGVTPTNNEINEIALNIRKYLSEKYKSDNMLLYGGSVNADNIEELNKVNSIDGYLIGGASTRANEFLKIINKCK